VKPTKILLLDLWRTLGFSIDREPILTVQETLGYNLQDMGDGRFEALPDWNFMRKCLTTDIKNPRRFLQHIASSVGATVSKEANRRFRELLERESSGFQLYEDTKPALVRLNESGVRLGLISNLWPFPVQRIVVGEGLSKYFEHTIYSFETHHAKPEPEIFLKALDVFNAPAQDFLMVGDNPTNDGTAAMAVGIDAAIIDRSGSGVVQAPGARVITSLLDLCTMGDWLR